MRRIAGATHPAHEARVARLKIELARWENERQKHLRKIEWQNKHLKGDWFSPWTWSTRRTSPGGTGDTAADAPPASADAFAMTEKMHKKPVSP